MIEKAIVLPTDGIDAAIELNGRKDIPREVLIAELEKALKLKVIEVPSLKGLIDKFKGDTWK